MNAENTHVVLFLSRATTLRDWDAMGILERETMLLRRLRARGLQVSVVTSGGRDELDYADRLRGMDILYNRWRLPPNMYSLAAPFLHHKALRRATLYRSNQMDGSWSAVIAGKLYRKPAIVRAGYLWASSFETVAGKSLSSARVRVMEKYSLRNASHIIVTTDAMKRDIVDQYGVGVDAVSVVPNYVDTDTFKPSRTLERVARRVCYVGRLSAEKNLELLITAVGRMAGVTMVFIGDGEQRDALEKLAIQLGVNMEVMGRVDHWRLPEELNRCEVFALTSNFEGHPKALIEAMACGTPVIGTDVRGIREVIRDGDNGLLCRPQVDDIKNALERLMNDEPLRIRLGEAARNFARQTYSLDRIVNLELEAYGKAGG